MRRVSKGKSRCGPWRDGGKHKRAAPEWHRRASRMVRDLENLGENPARLHWSGDWNVSHSKAIYKFDQMAARVGLRYYAEACWIHSFDIFVSSVDEDTARSIIVELSSHRTYYRRARVVKLPLGQLWTEQQSIVDAVRDEYVGFGRLRDIVQSGHAAFVVAEIGACLAWMDGRDCIRYWRDEVRDRLVDPSVSEEGFSPGDYPGKYCFTASVWIGDIRKNTVLLEKYE